MQSFINIAEPQINRLKSPETAVEVFPFILTVIAVIDFAMQTRTNNPAADRRSSEGRWVALSLPLSFAFSAWLALGTRPSVRPNSPLDSFLSHRNT